METLLIFAILIVAGVLALYLRAREVKDFYRRRSKAVSGTAKIVSVDSSENSKTTGQILANLSLEITPPSGNPYNLYDIQWFIEPAAASKVQPGTVMKIRIDPQDRRVIYPSERWAHLA